MARYKTKICSFCGELKPLVLFERRHTESSEYRNKCNTCRLLHKQRKMDIKAKIKDNPRNVCAICGVKMNESEVDTITIGIGYHVYICRSCLMEKFDKVKEIKVNAQKHYHSMRSFNDTSMFPISEDRQMEYQSV